MYKPIISVLCIILIVSLPISFAEEITQVIKEENFNPEESYTDLIINVNKYEPVVIVSSILEEQNIPVYAFLSGIPTTGLSLPAIQSINVDVISGNKSMLVGGINYIKPNYYTFNDLGYITLKLKKIEKETEVPDKIDIELKAKIKYEADITSELISGIEYKNLSEEPVLELEDILTNVKYLFFGGKGRISAERISGKTASFVLYNGEGEIISRFSAGEGKESGAYSLVRSSSLPEDFVRVRINKITDNTQNSAIITIDNIYHKIGIGTEILGWRINNINITNFNGDYVKYLELSRGKDRTVIIEGDLNINKKEAYNSISGLSFLIKKSFDEIEFNLIKNGFAELEHSFGNFIVKDFKEGEAPTAVINGEEIAKNSIINEKCKVIEITPDRVYIEDKNKNRQVLSLKTEAEREREIYYGQVRVSDTLSGEYCDKMLVLTGIDTKKSVDITLLSGRKTGATETTFWLHLPIEKRAITLSPKAIDRQINKTTEMIKKMDESITKLERVVKTWRKICLATTAAMLLVNMVRGLFGTGELAEKESKEKATEQLAAETAEAIDRLEKDDSKCPGSPGYSNLKGYKFSTGEDVYIYNKIPNVYYICDRGRISGAIQTPILKRVNPDRTLGEDVIWNGKEFVKYEGVTGDEFNRVRAATVEGKQVLIVPLRNPASLTFLSQQYAQWKVDPRTAGKSIYAVAYEEKIDFWIVNGKIIDIGDINKAKIEDNENVDQYLTTINKNGDRIERETYKQFEIKYLSSISNAQRNRETVVKLDGLNYKLDTTEQKFGELGEESCENIMSETQCFLIYNACDPVICPSSRCNLGGKAKVKDVIQSGFVGSTILCLPNFFAFKGKSGVAVPFCISGWLAAMKNMRSVLQAYVSCLTNSKINKLSTGICDKMRSIYYCQLIWQEVMSIFSLDRGLLGLLASKAVSSTKDSVSGISGAVKETSEGLNWFVNKYASEVFAIYKGRSTAEIGAELCKNAVAGKLPDIGKLMEEIAEPEDPVQFTAYFEEHPYAPTKGESRYQIYYHIYAGTPKREQSVIYKVFLQSKEKPFLLIGEGEIKSGEYADETIDKSGLMGYQEICVSINGVNTCGFGKTVSTSYILSEAHDLWMRKVGGLAPNITMKEQCVSTQEGVTPSYIPQAAVERRCALFNPDLGLGADMEQQWMPVGKCGVEGGKNLGICWQKMDLRKNPDLRYSVSEEVCTKQGGVWCNNNTVCDITMPMFSYDDSTKGHIECCYAGGKCVDIEKKEVKATTVEIKQKTPEEIINDIKASNCEEAEKILLENKEKLGDKYIDAQFEVGVSCYYDGNYDEAKQYLYDISREDLFDDTSYYMGLIWERLGDTQKTLAEKESYYYRSINSFEFILYRSKEYRDRALEAKRRVENKLLGK